MKYMVGYPVWNKADMISWYMEGLWTNMREHQVQTAVIFCFADCTDDSLAQFQRYSKNCLREFRVLPPIVIERAAGAFYITESAQHNALIAAFMKDGQCDALIVPQDDMKFNGNGMAHPSCRRPVLTHLDALFARFGEKLGCITGRDTYYDRFTEAAGSWWSASNLKYRLQPGEFRQGYLVNRGPIVYPRRLVEAIGCLDTEFLTVAYKESDYAARAHRAGFVNGAMGMDILHTRFGLNPQHYTLEYDKHGAPDLAKLLQRYPDAHPY
jgi:hypothetical protein